MFGRLKDWRRVATLGVVRQAHLRAHIDKLAFQLRGAGISARRPAQPWAGSNVLTLLVATGVPALALHAAFVEQGGTGSEPDIVVTASPLLFASQLKAAPLIFATGSSSVKCPPHMAIGNESQQNDLILFVKSVTPSVAGRDQHCHDRSGSVQIARQGRLARSIPTQ